MNKSYYVVFLSDLRINRKIDKNDEFGYSGLIEYEDMKLNNFSVIILEGPKKIRKGKKEVKFKEFFTGVPISVIDDGRSLNKKTPFLIDMKDYKLEELRVYELDSFDFNEKLSRIMDKNSESFNDYKTAWVEFVKKAQSIFNENQKIKQRLLRNAKKEKENIGKLVKSEKPAKKEEIESVIPIKGFSNTFRTLPLEDILFLTKSKGVYSFTRPSKDSSLSKYGNIVIEKKNDGYVECLTKMPIPIQEYTDPYDYNEEYQGECALYEDCDTPFFVYENREGSIGEPIHTIEELYSSLKKYENKSKGYSMFIKLFLSQVSKSIKLYQEKKAKELELFEKIDALRKMNYSEREIMETLLLAENKGEPRKLTY